MLIVDGGHRIVKKMIIGKCMNLIKKYHNYNNIKLAEIEYGLTAIYLTFSKLIVVSFLAFILGIFKEMIIFLLIYNIIRIPSFGIHATKSWLCLIISTIGFIGLPLLSMHIQIQLVFKIIIGIVGTILIFKNSPADTKKRPIVHPKRRLIYKILSTGCSISYVILSIIINNNFIENCLIFSIILQNIVISPLTYKLFKQPYNNYKEFLKLHPNFLN